MRVACRQGCGVGAGSRRRNVGRSSTAALGGRRRLRGARRAGLGTPAGIAAPTRACAVGARPPPRCQSSRPTTLAADTAGAALNLGVFERAVSVPTRASVSWKLPAVLLKLALGGPSTRACSGHARGVPPRRQRGADPRRRNVGRSCERCVGRAPSVAWGAAGRTHYACRYRRAHARMGGGRPPAAPLPTQPPNIARSRHRWRGPKPGRFLGRRRVPSRASLLWNLPAALLKLALGGPSAPAWSGHAGGVPPGLRCGGRIAPP